MYGRLYSLGRAWAALTALVLAVASGLAASSAPKPTLNQVDAAAGAILARARQWAGGTALKRVQSLTVKGAKGPRGQTMRPYDVRLLRPDRFQTRQERWVHTLEGSAFWMVGPVEWFGLLTPEVNATAERGLRSNFVSTAMTFLIWAPESIGISLAHAGKVDLEGLAGDGVHASLRGRDGTTFVFASDGRPLGYLGGATAPSGANVERVVAFFKDHREVGGVRFPFHVESRYGPGPSVVDWSITDIRLNELKSADFQRGGRWPAAIGRSPEGPQSRR